MDLGGVSGGMDVVGVCFVLQACFHTACWAIVQTDSIRGVRDRFLDFYRHSIAGMLDTPGVAGLYNPADTTFFDIESTQDDL